MQTSKSLSFLLLATFVSAYSQDMPVRLTLEDAVKSALVNHPVSQNSAMKVQEAQLKRHFMPTFSPTEVNYSYGQEHSSFYDNRVDIRQSFGSPITQIQKHRVDIENSRLATAEQRLVLKQVILDVKQAWFRLLFAQCKLAELKNETKRLLVVEDLLRQMNDKGDTAALDRIVLETDYAEIQNAQFQADQELLIANNRFQQAVYLNQAVTPADTSLELYAIVTHSNGIDKFLPADHIGYYQKLADVRKAELKVAQSGYAPEIYAGYFTQELNHQSGFQGISAGFSLPLWFVPQKRDVSAARIELAVAKNEAEYQKFMLSKDIENLRIELDQAFVAISYYRENALRQADLIEKTADVNYSRKQMNVHDFIDAARTTSRIRIEYLEKMLQYNLTAVRLEYYVN